MTVEDQLRAAGRAVSDQVRDLPRLDLPAQPAARRARARGFRRRPGAGRWLIPLAAAAAVVTVTATLIAVKNPPRAAQRADASPATSRSAGPAGSSSAGPTATAEPVDPDALPRYFVALDGFAVTGKIRSGQSTPVKPDSVVVGETLTGRRTATIPAPAGSTFAGVTGAADHRTFVLDSVAIPPYGGFLPATGQRTWYLLRIGPSGTPVQKLTALDVPVPGDADVNGVALSPDGTKLAVLYQLPRKGDAFPYSGPFTLAIYSIATGAVLRNWTGTDHHASYSYGSNLPPDPNATVTWTADGQRLAFAFRGSSISLYLREVSLASPPGDLFAASTVVATIAVSPSTGRAKIWCDSLGITGDGRSAVCGATLQVLPKPGSWAGCTTPADGVEYPGLVRIPLAGDRRAQVLYDAEPECAGAGYASVLWSSPSGDTVLGAVSYVDDASAQHPSVVLYRHGTVTTVNWPGAAGLLLANQTAF